MTWVRRIKCITFDLDDTLWACAPVILRAEQALYEWLAQRCPRITEAYTLEQLRDQRKALWAERKDLQHDMTQLRREWMAQLAEAFGYPQEIIEPAVSYFRRYRNRVTLFDEAERLLKVLRSTYTLGAITNGNIQLDKAGVDHLFDFVIYSAEVGVAKPDVRIFHAALAQAEAQPEQSVHVGDDPETDVLGALHAGLLTVWVNTAKKPWPRGSAPGEEIHSLEELHDALERLEGAAGL